MSKRCSGADVSQITDDCEPDTYITAVQRERSVAYVQHALAHLQRAAHLGTHTKRDVESLAHGNQA